MNTPTLAPSLRPPQHATPDLRLCAACGGYHGSVGFELQCLRDALETARAALRAQSPSSATATK
jgi:hypothetical protein